MTWQELEKTYKGKRVFLTGHTGFKGAWLLQILHKLGAIVKGYSLAPENTNDLFVQIKGETLCESSVIADINNYEVLEKELTSFKPDFVFHLAAQALVRPSYAMPALTFLTNVQGTVHVLEAIRHCAQPVVGIMITTDKVYENPERGEPFKEDDKLGGYDPYSASKAAAEIAISSYMRSFFNSNDFDKHHKAIAAVRAGNVIGGGDYSKDRIIPDIVRSLEHNTPVKLRNPQSVRPWQHVLEPLAAYLILGAKLQDTGSAYAGTYNIGPETDDVKTVAYLTRVFLNQFGKTEDFISFDTTAEQVHEARLLLLDNQKIKDTTGWQPQFSAEEAISLSAQWYADTQASALEKCTVQINYYFRK